jgi:hypothetical protein
MILITWCTKPYSPPPHLTPSLPRPLLRFPTHRHQQQMALWQRSGLASPSNSNREATAPQPPPRCRHLDRQCWTVGKGAELIDRSVRQARTLTTAEMLVGWSGS